jgi:hypothetical protein
VGQVLANAEFLMWETLAEGLNPPPPVDYEQWAVNNVSFSDRESQFTGPYNPSRFKPFTEIYKALSPAADFESRLFRVRQLGKREPKAAQPWATRTPEVWMG